MFLSRSMPFSHFPLSYVFSVFTLRSLFSLPPDYMSLPFTPYMYFLPVSCLSCLLLSFVSVAYKPACVCLSLPVNFYLFPACILTPFVLASASQSWHPACSFALFVFVLHPPTHLLRIRPSLTLDLLLCPEPSSSTLLLPTPVPVL